MPDLVEPAAGAVDAAADLERLAVAAHLAGDDDASARAWERAHTAWLQAGDADRAARCAFWLGLGLLFRGEMAPGGGWLARAERIVAEAEHECSARGLLLVPSFLGTLESGDPDAAGALAADIAAIGRRLADPDVLAFGVLASGQAALALGDTARGMRLLDEVMVSVITGEVSPITAGIVYCAVIEACMDALDLRRAAEWTDALQRWCDAQPGIVPYRGQCLVHRSQVFQAHGAWSEAVVEADRARQRLSEPAHPALGLAWYQRGELHRLRGEVAEAEQAYRAAREQGREPVPGIALLQLAQGNPGAAAATARRMVDASEGLITRPVMLAAAVEVLMAAGDRAGAREASVELDALAASRPVRLLEATAAYATGSVLVAETNGEAAIARLQRAEAVWRELDMPYDVARARTQLAAAWLALGDRRAADIELDAAQQVFDRLGAEPDMRRVSHLRAPASMGGRSALTERECEVLRLVATGQTNREIAAHLVISKHTVARHLQNIFLKLDLSSRAAATAYAYEHGLV